MSMTDIPDTQLILQLRRIDELFNAPDANPFSSREIDILGESGFDVLWKRMVRRWPQRPDLQRRYGNYFSTYLQRRFAGQPDHRR